MGRQQKKTRPQKVPAKKPTREPRIVKASGRPWPVWTDAFLAEYAECGNISLAAKRVGIERHTPTDLRDKDPEGFGVAFAAAHEEATDKLVAEARRRGLEGWEEPVYGRVARDQDGQIGVVRKYSDTLLIFMLKGARPEVYRERYEPKGPALSVNMTPAELAAMSDADLEQLKSRLSE